MSLKVWLPLNGSLENKGLLQFKSTNNVGAVVSSAGKIGSCYSFNGSDQRIDFVHDKTIWSNKEISICMWYKYAEGNTTNTMVDIAADLCLSYTYSSSGVRFNYWRAYSNNGTRTGDTGSGNYYDASQWHHVVLTCDHNINKIYVDGILDATFDRSSKYTTNWAPLLGTSYNKITLAKSAGSSPYGSGYLNDVRIYDHCLSAAEVHEISQGLVLHYKLDDNIQTITNAYNMTSWNTNTARGGFSSWGNSGHQGSYGTNTDRSYIYNVDRTYSYWVANGSESTPLTYLFYQSPAFEGGYRSLSAILKEENGNLITEDIIRPAWNANVVGEGHAPAAKWTRVIPLGNGFYLCQVDGLYQDGSNDLAGLNVTRGHKVYISEIWLENNKQVASNPIFPSTMIQDSSGYGYNGTIVGNPIISNDTARFSHSLDFNGTDIITRNTLNADIRTLSCWVKTTKNKSTSQMMIADSASNMCISFYSGTIIGVFGTTRSTGSKSTLGDSYKENDWNHIVVVKVNDAGARDIYCNGVKLAAAANDYWGSSAGFHVGNRKSTTDGNTPFYGYLNDVRAYCTALSADDIKQLYQVGAKVDNLGNWHTFEFQEKGLNKITKIGIIQGQQINEINNLSQLKYDPNVYIEPDGSAWVRIFHHNNPANARFTSSDTFATSVYKDADRWFNVQVCDSVTAWEFMLKQKAESTTTTESKYRWIQTVNPMTALYEDVAAANITKITTGYSNFTHGGLYKKNSSTYLCTNNGATSNWWGAVGAWTLSSGGNPSWASTVVKSGYIDLYLRIDNITTTLPQIAKSTKNNIWLGHNLIEK